MCTGRTFVSSCRCCVFVSLVQPVAMRRAVFCIVCRCLVFVLEMIVLHVVFAYSNMGRVMVLNVEIMSSLCLPHLVDVSALRMLRVRFAFCAVSLVCCENVSLGSNVIPRILGCLVVGSV